MRIACLLTNDFEDSEFQKPAEALRSAGHDVVVIGPEDGKEITGKRHQATTRSHKGIADVRPDDFDALFIPGGYSPDQLRADRRFVDFTRAFFERERPVFAVCHGPQLLLTAGVVKGRRITAWKTIQVDLRHAGANVVDEEVVVDGNLVTSRQPSDLDAFSREAVKMLQSAAATVR